MPLIHNKRVFFLAVACGAIISASHYLLPPLEAQGSQLLAHPLRWPVVLLAALNLVHRIFIARIFLEALGLPAWLGEALGFLYWPVLGAFVGASKHWVLWGAAVLAVNIGLLVLFFYALSQMRSLSL